MESYISGEIKKGDLIFVVEDKYGTAAFYLGNHQYYTINSLWNWFIVDKKDKPYKSHMKKYLPDRIVKYSPELIINPEVRDTYETALEALKLLNI
jgi:hypothetical protein